MLVFLSLIGCGNGGTAAQRAPVGDAPHWGTIFWVNSNSGPTFQWSLAGVAAASYVAVPLSGIPSGSGGGCAPFGGAVTPGVAAKSLHDALADGAPLAVWMQPRDHEFDGVAPADLASAAQAALEAFQACVTQDWGAAPTVSGFLCVKEQQLGGAANCDTLAAVFAQGVHIAGLASAVRYGILAAPGSMNRTDAVLCGRVGGAEPGSRRPITLPS